ncbi:MAG: TIGR00266 family protein [Christensenellales bacterium]|jgi:uncharacterized protein (TIGR00266 family)
MRYEIFGGSLPALRVSLEEGESVCTQSGGMCWMSDGISIDTNIKGGLLKGISRVFSGDNLFLATFTAEKENQTLICASKFPGEMLCLQMEEGREIIIQRDAFLLAQPGVRVATETVKGMGRRFFGREAIALQRLSGQGLVFLELDGSTQTVELAEGERLLATTGNVAAYETGVQYTVQTVRGFRNMLFGGDGLNLACLEGPGKVWLQTMTMHDFAGKLAPFMPGNEEKQQP